MEFDEDEYCVGGLVPKFGAIFMSNGATKRECLKRKLFGLPLSMANFVKKVKSGMILFLFEFEKRELYGVFQATSDGTMNLKPYAFTSSGKQFPAQVRIAPIWSCSPLPEVVFRDAIKDNYYSPNKFHFGLSEKQVRVLLELFYPRRLNNRMPPRQIGDEMTREAKKYKTDCNLYAGSCTSSTEHIGNSLVGLVGADREKLLIEDRFKNYHNIGKGIEPQILPVFPRYSTLSEENIVADDFRLSKDDRLENAYDVESCIRLNSSSDVTKALCISDHNIGKGIEPDILPVFPRYSTLSEDVADAFRFSKDDRLENACDVDSCIRPDFTKAFRMSEQNLFMNSTESSHSKHLYTNPIKPNLESDCFTLRDPFQYYSACHLPNVSKSFTQTSLVSNNAPSRTVPYDPEFPDMKYGCSSPILDSARDLSSHILDLAQDLSSHQVHDENFLPLSTSKCVTHEAALGSLYPEAPLVKASVFSRLSVALRKRKKEDENGIGEENDRLESIDEIMDSLHQAHNRWEKCKPSVGANSRYVYVRRKEESKCPNQLRSEQPVVKKEMTIDVNRFLEEDSDTALKETRVVDFKRRSKKNKNMNDLVTIVSTGTTTGMTSETSVDATGEDMVGKAGKSRKLIRPDFRKKECPRESCDISDMTAKNTQSTTFEDSTFSRKTVEGIVSTSSKKICVALSTFVNPRC